MFITTKAEFIWDGEKYVETHTEGYEYEGELALADIEDDIDTLTSPTSPYGGYTPSLYDLMNKDIAEIMKNMGFDEADIEKYAGYIPEFDPWKAGYALEEKGVGEERIGLDAQRIGIEEKGLGLQRKLTEDLFGFGKKGLSQQMFGAAQAGEQSLYQASQEGAAVEAAGLGKRTGITERGKRAAMSQYGGQMETLALQGLEQETKYQASLEQLGLDVAALGFDRQELGLDRQMLDIDYRRDVEEEQRDYENEFWEFLSFLKTEYEVGFT